MSEIKDGGPAFPGKQSTIIIPCECTHAKQINVDMNGMSLRDWFAGMALQGYFSGLLANPKTFVPDLKSDQAAKTAYEIADAMLKKRDKNSK